MHCIVCQSTKVTHLLNPYRGGAIYVCGVCTNAFTVPIPQVAYDDNHFFEGAVRDADRFQEYARRVLRFIAGQKKPGTLLDIGTGGGYMVEEAGKQGWQASGLEPSEQAVRFCRKRGLDVHQGYVESMSLPSRHYDIIVASHVIEHVHDASRFLAIVRPLLKPDGFLILCQTNYQGTLPRWYGKFWENWVPKEHLIHFSPKGMKFFLEHHDWQVKQCEILPLGYYPRWVWGRRAEMATNIYYTLSYLIGKFRIGFPFVGDQFYTAAYPKKGKKK